jgi:predicted fused transcriptional regulator/phosphomethylpyrimidine kinase
MAEEAILIDAENTILLKRALAKNLYDNFIDQSKISEILNLSQPMVSNYCRCKEKIPKNIQKLANQICDTIIDGGPLTFHTCVSFTHKPYEGNYIVAEKSELISDERNKLVNNLTEAFFILKGKNIKRLIPQVKINIAMAKENPKNQSDIAAFLNGLTIVDDRIAEYNGVRFGNSKHLSSLLLGFKDKLDAKAIMNIAYVKGIKNAGFNVGYLTKDFKLKDGRKNIDILVHEGDFGIEPCAYVLGKDAIDVSKKVLKIADGLKNEK